jgi:PEP-CTERM motif
MKLLRVYVAGAVLTSAMFAGNIVANSGFETGDFSNWEQGDFHIGDSTGFIPPHSGNFLAFTGCVGRACITDASNSLKMNNLAQTDGTFTLSFFYELGSTDSNNPLSDQAELRVLWGNIEVLDVKAVEAPDPGFAFFAIGGLPGDTDGGIQLQFFGRNDPTHLGIDDVCVAPTGDNTCGIPTTTAAPEPDSLWLLGGGFLGIALASRRRLKAVR